MMNVSGNFATTEREIEVVKRILAKEAVSYAQVTKNADPDDGDVLVRLDNGKTILIEVKEERYDRFAKYGDLGIDFISVFHFKKTARAWKGAPKSPNLLSAFLEDIDRKKPYKGGKIFYSKSDLWLFFVENNGELQYYFFDGKRLLCDEFRTYLKTHCLFAVNNKPSWQMSNTDAHNSAVFFIKPDDSVLQTYSVALGEYVRQQ